MVNACLCLVAVALPLCPQENGQVCPFGHPPPAGGVPIWVMGELADDHGPGKQTTYMKQLKKSKTGFYKQQAVGVGLGWLLQTKRYTILDKELTINFF